MPIFQTSTKDIEELSANFASYLEEFLSSTMASHESLASNYL